MKKDKNTIYDLQPPSNIQQDLFRLMLQQQFKNKKNKHCMICGDEDDLVECKTKQKGIVYLCSFCYELQTGSNSNQFL